MCVATAIGGCEAAAVRPPPDTLIDSRAENRAGDVDAGDDDRGVALATPAWCALSARPLALAAAVALAASCMAASNSACSVACRGGGGGALANSFGVDTRSCWDSKSPRLIRCAKNDIAMGRGRLTSGGDGQVGEVQLRTTRNSRQEWTTRHEA